MPITAATFSATYAQIPNVYRQRFIDGATEIQPVYPLVFNVEGSNQAKEFISDFDGLEQWSAVGEGVEIPEQTPVEGRETYWEHVKYASKIQYTEEAMSDGKYREIAQLAENMGRMAVHLVETKAASVFNNAFNSSYVGMDSKELCATDHPLKASGGTEQNEPSSAADLSYASWEQCELDMMATVDEAGQKSPYYPRLLLVAPGNRITASKIFGSEVTSAENQFNAYRSAGVQIVVWPFLTDADAWFALDPRHKLTWLWRWPLFFRRWADFNTMSEFYAGAMRFTYGWGSWRGVYGSPGV